MTQAVAAVFGGGIAGVFPEAEVVRFDVVINLGTTPVQEGTDDFEMGADPLLVTHPGESLEAGTPAKIGEDGLGLVIGVMGHEDIRGMVFHGHAGEEVVPCFPGSSLDGHAVLRG